MKWRGDYSEDRRWMLMASSVYIGPGIPRAREVQLCESDNDDGGPPYTRTHGIFNTRREAKAEAARLADGGA